MKTLFNVLFVLAIIAAAPVFIHVFSGNTNTAYRPSAIDSFLKNPSIEGAWYAFVYLAGFNILSVLSLIAGAALYFRKQKGVIPQVIILILLIISTSSIIASRPSFLDEIKKRNDDYTERLFREELRKAGR